MTRIGWRSRLSDPRRRIGYRHLPRHRWLTAGDNYLDPSTGGRHDTDYGAGGRFARDGCLRPRTQRIAVPGVQSIHTDADRRVALSTVTGLRKADRTGFVSNSPHVPGGDRRALLAFRTDVTSPSSNAPASRAAHRRRRIAGGQARFGRIAGAVRQRDRHVGVAGRRHPRGRTARGPAGSGVRTGLRHAN